MNMRFMAYYYIFYRRCACYEVVCIYRYIYIYNFIECKKKRNKKYEFSAVDRLKDV